MSNEMNTQEEKKVLTQKDLNKAMFRWYMSAEMPLNFENMQGIAFCGSISHILKKLYTKKEDLSEALKSKILIELAFGVDKKSTEELAVVEAPKKKFKL